MEYIKDNCTNAIFVFKIFDILYEKEKDKGTYKTRLWFYDLYLISIINNKTKH